MKKSDLTPGTKVLVSIDNNYDSDTYEEFVPFYLNKDAYDDDDTYLIGTVLDKPSDSNKVWVSFPENDLGVLSEEEVECNVLSLESDLAKLEAEFEAYSKEIKEKVKAAAALLKEANTLAKKAHVKNLSEMYDAVAPLINVMDSSGWNSSSWGC